MNNATPISCNKARTFFAIMVFVGTCSTIFTLPPLP